MIAADVFRGTSGIYEIVNTVSGDRYYGSAQCLGRRWLAHRACLRGQRHENERLQRAWSKYGEDAFAFRVLAVLEPSELVATEQRLLDRRVGTADCYNMARNAENPMRGRRHTAESREKMSSAKRGRPGALASPETRAKLSAASRGRGLGSKASAETRAKMSRAQRGRRHGPATRAKLSALKTGLRHSAEVKAKIGAIATARLAPVFHAAVQATPKGFCACGCGDRPPIATRTSRRDGAVRGEPRRFIAQHHLRLLTRGPSECRS